MKSSTSRIKKIALGLTTSLIFLILGSSLMLARMAVYPVWYRHYKFDGTLPPCSNYQERVYKYCFDPKKSLKLDFEEVKLEEPILTTGWWVKVPPEKRRGFFVLSHGAGADRRAMLKHVRYLNQAGYETLDIDCFNHGMTASNGKGISFGFHEAFSILAGSEFLKKQDPKLPVFVMGTSQGGFSVLRAAALDKKENIHSIDAVVSENPYISVKEVLLDYNHFPIVGSVPLPIKKLALFWISKWIGTDLDELDVHRFADQLKDTPIFLLHGDADHVVELSQSQAINTVLQTAQHPLLTEFWIVPNGKHEFLWNENQVEFEKRILTWTDSISRTFSKTH